MTTIDRLLAGDLGRLAEVVILSARTEARDKIRGLQEGALHFLTKPFAVKGVLETIDTVLSEDAED